MYAFYELNEEEPQLNTIQTMKRIQNDVQDDEIRQSI